MKAYAAAAYVLRAREGRGGQRRPGIAAVPGHLTGYVGAP
jgi:hypothetical protein